MVAMFAAATAAEWYAGPQPWGDGGGLAQDHAGTVTPAWAVRPPPVDGAARLLGGSGGVRCVPGRRRRRPWFRQLSAALSGGGRGAALGADQLCSECDHDAQSAATRLGPRRSRVWQAGGSAREAQGPARRSELAGSSKEGDRTLLTPCHSGGGRGARDAATRIGFGAASIVWNKLRSLKRRPRRLRRRGLQRVGVGSVRSDALCIPNPSRFKSKGAFAPNRLVGLAKAFVIKRVTVCDHGPRVGRADHVGADEALSSHNA
jgi:hypothetical protein